jgi:hypothetical protein
MFRDRRKGKDLERALLRLQSESDRGTPDQDAGAADEELKELSALAMEVKRSLEVPGPRQAFRRAAKARILREMRLRAAERTSTPAPTPRVSILRPAYILASLALVIAFLTTGIGVGHAAGNALPGEALYGVKQRIEQGRLLLSITEEGDFQLLSEFADERLFEIERLVSMGRDELVGSTAADYEAILLELTTMAVGFGGAGEPSFEHVRDQLQHHIDVLDEVREKVPENAKAAIDKAIERSSHSQDVINALESGESPSDLAPGQLKKTEGAPETQGQDEAGQGENAGGDPPDDVETGPPDTPPGQDKDKDKDKNRNSGSDNRGQGNNNPPGLAD